MYIAKDQDPTVAIHAIYVVKVLCLSGGTRGRSMSRQRFLRSTALCQDAKEPALMGSPVATTKKCTSEVYTNTLSKGSQRKLSTDKAWNNSGRRGGSKVRILVVLCGGLVLAKVRVCCLYGFCFV